MVYVIRVGGDDGIETQVGVIGETTLEQAVWKAMELQNLKMPSNFAIFPVKSGREEYYMAVERELLRQEASPEFNGKLMWQMMSAGDPRELVEMIMLQIRECAQSIVHPVSFQEALLRTACLIVSSMQWVSDWIGRLRVRQSVMETQTPMAPKVVDFTPTPEVHPSAPVPPLFGIAGLQAVETPAAPETEKEGDVDEPPPASPPAPVGKRKRNRKRKH